MRSDRTDAAVESYMIQVCSFYTFCPLSEAQLQSAAGLFGEQVQESGLKGLVVLASEGLNATIAGSREACEQFIALLEQWAQVVISDLKWSSCPEIPFRRFKVDLRKDIIDAGTEYLPPTMQPESMLSPEEFHERIGQPGTVLIDVRNDYESKVGTFDGACTPPLQRFSELAPFIKESTIDRSAEVLIFCTGGIRCEKALTIMQREGFQRVRQLQGGILRYLEQFGVEGKFRGECFVFDSRVAVDGALAPSTQYKLCRRCGDPTTTLQGCPICKNDVPYCSTCAATQRPCSRSCEASSTQQRAHVS